jgi:hypothetical protein
MSAEWTFIDATRVGSRNRFNPPSKVRDLVIFDHSYQGDCVFWYYDDEKNFAVISSNENLDFVNFGMSPLDQNNTVTSYSGIVDAAFPDLSRGDSLVFLGHENSVEEEKYLYMLHEQQMYDLMPAEGEISDKFSK